MPCNVGSQLPMRVHACRYHSFKLCLVSNDPCTWYCLHDCRWMTQKKAKKTFKRVACGLAAVAAVALLLLCTCYIPSRHQGLPSPSSVPVSGILDAAQSSTYLQPATPEQDALTATKAILDASPANTSSHNPSDARSGPSLTEPSSHPGADAATIPAGHPPTSIHQPIGWNNTLLPEEQTNDAALVPLVSSPSTITTTTMIDSPPPPAPRHLVVDAGDPAPTPLAHPMDLVRWLFHQAGTSPAKGLLDGWSCPKDDILQQIFAAMQVLAAPVYAAPHIYQQSPEPAPSGASATPTSPVQQSADLYSDPADITHQAAPSSSDAVGSGQADPPSSTSADIMLLVDLPSGSPIAADTAAPPSSDLAAITDLAAPIIPSATPRSTVHVVLCIWAGLGTLSTVFLVMLLAIMQRRQLLRSVLFRPSPHSSDVDAVPESPVAGVGSTV